MNGPSMKGGSHANAPHGTASGATVRPPASAALKLGIDYGPLAIFFLVNFLLPGDPIARVMVGTAVFMAATIAAMVVSRVKLGTISPMLWLSGVLVVVFGGLTIWFHDASFIKMKPTIVYALLAALLLFGLATGRPLLQTALGEAYPGLSATGWRKLTRNWALFFVGMAALNEAVWRNTSWDVWVAYKLWGAMPLTLVFALANIPMLMRHGLSTDGVRAAAEELPPEA